MATKNIITTVFIDIEDSTGIANYLEKEKYQNFLSEFHKTIKKVLTRSEWAVLTEEINHKFMGDEFIAFFPHSEYADDALALEYALRLASILKYEWYFSKYNRLRLKGDKELIELNIGINTGDVSLMPYPILSKKKRKNKTSYEGFPITLAKRLQSVAEESQSSRIIVGDRFYREYSTKTNYGYEFHYVGQKYFKGIAQRISCYEWLGSDFYDEHLDFKNTDNKKVYKTLKALYDKNPHNPWYASLLANYYFFLGEEEYNKDNYDNEFYKSCAKICIDALSNITNYNLRKLNELLFNCLEIEGNWDELCFRSEQAFNSDQTFSGALAFNSKALYKRGEKFANDAKEAASRLIVLFPHTHDFESLYTAHFTLARYLSLYEFDKTKAIHHLKAAVHYAQKGDIYWAYKEYDFDRADFENIKDSKEFKKEITKLKKMWETED